MAYYETHPRTHNLSFYVNETLARMKMRTTILPRRNDDTRSSGGLAVLIRGGAFRGAPSDTLEYRFGAQVEAAQSVEHRLLRPFREAGSRAEAFLTVYDADYCAGSGGPASQYDGSQLWRPYASSLRAITVISAATAEQISAVAASLRVFLDYCARHSQAFDAVVLTRFDMRFKVSLAAVLGAEARLSTIAGVRFLWHELGNNWRAAWSPMPEDIARADEKQRGAWSKLTQSMISNSAKVFRGDHWKKDTRVPDTFFLLGFNHTACFLRAVHHEMALGWPPHPSHILQAIHGERGTLRGAHMQRVGEVIRAHPDVRKVDELNISLAPLFPWNHWLHKMMPHVAKALHVNEASAEWRVNRSFGHTLRYVYPTGAWSSNPCAGACMLNPLYVTQHPCLDRASSSLTVPPPLCPCLL